MEVFSGIRLACHSLCAVYVGVKDVQKPPIVRWNAPAQMNLGKKARYMENLYDLRTYGAT
jgi:hypothetical protein